MTVVLDASALLAYIKAEIGQEIVESAISEAVITTVNWAEVAQKLYAAGSDAETTLQELRKADLAVSPFTAKDAIVSAKLWQSTKRYGLSLADRACLGLAIQLDVPVLTADRVWSEIDLPVDVQLIR